ncbi:hypothetical protein L9G74_06395 [Shewanella sp. C32]|uniref:Uncharacterized protein n=1 Tax=Shewanella electrica TaxID=515560 RepID=A0ABT2FIA7_9GAMM|nr:hypothetical protein [Shewanella electrica]MCH1924160.1 hypothetical protein [Shewanella electrica]MCS4556063.1 hypothetical protein [Shewanella electrica]
MKTRNRLTILESDIIATVDDVKEGLGELQVRCLNHGPQRVRYMVISAKELEKKLFSVQILAEAQFNYQQQKLAFIPMGLSTATALKVESIIKHLVNVDGDG